MILDISRRAAGTRALPIALATLTAALVVGCESSQIAAPVGQGVQWTRITDASVVPGAYYATWRGNRIAFGSLTFPPTRSLLAVVNPDGTDLVKLEPFPSSVEVAPRWVDDTTLVFSSYRDSSDFNLWYRTLSGATLRILTADPINEWDPAPRPGSPTLAYVEGQNQYRGRIALIPDTAATPLGKVYLTPASLQAGEPDWDPSGQRVCFSADSANGTRHVFLIDLATDTVAVQLTTGPFIDQTPRFSPDGTRILFSSNRTGRSGLWTVSPAGEGVALQVVAFADAGRTLNYPAWSPDGLRIVVSMEGTGLPTALWILSNLP